MTKKDENKQTSKKNISTPKKPSNKPKAKKTTRKIRHVNKKVAYTIIVCLGIFLIVSSYAWFSTNLNVKVNMFRFTVTRDSDLQISFDGINWDYSLDISEDFLMRELPKTYPNHTSQWSASGMIPVSTYGNPDANTDRFEIYETSGVLYKKKKKGIRTTKKNGFFIATKADQSKPREFNSYIAFDLFIRNKNNSPKQDNLFIDDSTAIIADEETSEQMLGLVNSLRLGILKIGSVNLNAPVNQIQNVKCNNQCTSIIYEPNSKEHSPISIEKALNLDVNLVDGIPFPTYAVIKDGGPYYLRDNVQGSTKIDPTAFKLQNTIDESGFRNPIFQIPNGITKTRIYLWVEGQDIDSIETHSDGTELSINIDFIKDTAGYEGF